VQIISGEIVSRYLYSALVNDQRSSEVCRKVLDNSVPDDLFAGGIFFCRGDNFERALELRSDFLKKMNIGEVQFMLQYIPVEYQMSAVRQLQNGAHADAFTYGTTMEDRDSRSSGGCNVSFF